MGDFKPSLELKSNLPESVILGIENHRLVDRLTDAHTAVKDLRPLFSPQRRRYAGVVTDIAFDYFLIKHWKPERDGDFDEFVDNSYQGLESRLALMPDRMSFVVEKMLEHDWLRSYATLGGIDQTINHVSKRIRFENSMAGSIDEVEKNYAQIEQGFIELFRFLRVQVDQARVEKTTPPWA